MPKQSIPKTPLPFRILRATFPFLEKFVTPLARYIVVRLFFTPFRFPPKQEELDMQAKAERFTLMVNNNEVVAHKWGNEGPVAVLVHGWSGRGMQLRLFVEPLLKQGYQVLSFDAPGHGESTGTDSSLLEIRDSLFALSERVGTPSLAIGHSLGGAAILFAIKEGMKIDRVVTLSTPSLADKILEEYLRRINGSLKMGSAIDNYVLNRTGNHFAYYAASYNATFIQEAPILSFHDHNDREAGIEHAYALRDANSLVTLIETEGLGHNRILKDEAVIQKAIDFASLDVLV